MTFGIELPTIIDMSLKKKTELSVLMYLYIYQLYTSSIDLSYSVHITFLTLTGFLSLSVCLSIYLSLFISIFLTLSGFLTLSCLSIDLSSLFISIFLLSLAFLLCLSVYRSILVCSYQSFLLSLWLSYSVCLSIYFSLFISLFLILS